MHDTFVDELNSVISLIYYIVMMLISVITLSIAVIKLFPKIKCSCYFVEDISNGTKNIFLHCCFVNVRSKTIVVDKAQLTFNTDSDNRFVKIKNCAVVSGKNAEAVLQMPNSIFAKLSEVKCIYIYDIFEKKYKTQLRKW